MYIDFQFIFLNKIFKTYIYILYTIVHTRIFKSWRGFIPVGAKCVRSICMKERKVTVNIYGE